MEGSWTLTMSHWEKPLVRETNRHALKTNAFESDVPLTPKMPPNSPMRSQSFDHFRLKVLLGVKN